MSEPYVYELTPVSGADGRALLAAEASADRLALVDLLDRVLAGGVVITGDITLAIADVDLITVSLRAVVASVSALAGKETVDCPGPRSVDASTRIQTRSSRGW